MNYNTKLPLYLRRKPPAAVDEQLAVSAEKKGLRNFRNPLIFPDPAETNYFFTVTSQTVTPISLMLEVRLYVIVSFFELPSFAAIVYSTLMGQSPAT